MVKSLNWFEDVSHSVKTKVRKNFSGATRPL
jgi:hypothetical protein